MGKTAVTVGYNPGRSISSKSDVGSYGYHGTNKRMTQVTTASGLVMPANHTLTYNNSNRPASVSGGGYTRSYLYDAHNQRTYSELTTVNSNPLYAPCKRYYFGDYERIINTNNNLVSNIDYIFTP